jgi:hypothetical protein
MRAGPGSGELEHRKKTLQVNVQALARRTTAARDLALRVHPRRE